MIIWNTVFETRLNIFKRKSLDYAINLMYLFLMHVMILMHVDIFQGMQNTKRIAVKFLRSRLARIFFFSNSLADLLLTFLQRRSEIFINNSIHDIRN